MTAVLDPVTCRFCPVVLHCVAVPSWTSGAGPTTPVPGSATLKPDMAQLKPDPYSYLAGLGDRALAMMKATPRSKPHPPECDRLMAEYSALKVRLDFGGTFHQHYSARGTEPAYDGPPAPEHCGWPGRLRPSGWQFRQCGEALALAAESAA